MVHKDLVKEDIVKCSGLEGFCGKDLSSWQGAVPVMILCWKQIPHFLLVLLVICPKSDAHCCLPETRLACLSNQV